MGSEGNKFNDGTSSFQPSETTLCANGCGFFGTPATMGLCSKCHRDSKIAEEQKTMAKVAVEKLVVNRPSAGKAGSASLMAVVDNSAPAEETAVVPVVGSGSDKAPTVAVSNRCLTCRKKVGVVGFKCRCGRTFCGTHRYPEQHDCTFDFKSKGKEEIAKANPVIKADKIVRI